MRFLTNLGVDYNKRVYGLDVVRAIAILLVVFGHSTKIVRHHLPAAAKNAVKTFVVGFDGVDLFFVLSGFLIGSIFLKIVYKENALSFKKVLNFWKRRWYRTLPNYYLVLIVNIIVLFLLGNTISMSDLLPYFPFLQNFAYPMPSFFVESWSLSIEEWFYLLMPVLFLLSFKVLPKTVKINRVFIIPILLIIVTSISFRVYHASFNPEVVDAWEAWFRKSVLSRLESIMFGVIGAFIKINYNKLWNWNVKRYMQIGLVLIICSFYMAFIAGGSVGLYYKQVFHFTVTGIGILLLLPYFDNMKSMSTSFGKVITHISLVSYSLYLINYTFTFSILELFPYKQGVYSIISFFAFWIGTIVLATIMYKYFEKPILEYRNRKVAE